MEVETEVVQENSINQEVNSEVVIDHSEEEAEVVLREEVIDLSVKDHTEAEVDSEEMIMNRDHHSEINKILMIDHQEMREEEAVEEVSAEAEITSTPIDLITTTVDSEEEIDHKEEVQDNTTECSSIS